MALAPLLYNITFDSQTRILYFWDKAGHEIYHCEIPSPAPALPTVTTLYLNPSHTAVEVVDTGLFGAGYTLYYENGDTYSESTIPMLGAAFGQNVQWSPSDVSNRFELVLRNNKVVLDGKGTYSSYVQRIEICADTDTTIITVYDSSNNPYNAFKYTSDGTDYYYVLDGTQTDWTDDLSSIGYHLPAQTLELVVWVADTIAAQTFGANDYWYSRIGSESDAQALIDFGGEVITDGQCKYIKVLNTLFYDLVNMYGGTNVPIPSADLSNFWLAKGSNNYSGSLYIRSINAYSTAIKTWRVRITENKDNVSWMMSDQSDVFIGYAGSHQLYDAGGNAILYDSTKTYTIVGYYTGANYVSLDRLTTSNNQYFSFVNYNSSGYLGIKSSDSSANYLMQRVIYKVK